MKLNFLFFLIFNLVATQAHADPVAFLGINYTLKGHVGFSVKVLNDRDEDKAIMGVGVSYYPFAQERFGLDLSGGYTIDNSAALLGYDFLQNSFLMSGGWANTKNPSPPASNITESETQNSGNSGGLTLGGSFPS